MISIEYILTAIAIVLVISIAMSKLSEKLGIPSLLLFLLIGILAGKGGLEILNFDNARVAQSLGVLALAYILFAGGLDTDWQSVKPVLAKGLSLSTIGVLFTAAIVAFFSKYILGFTWPEGMLLGAIVSSTDAAAVFSVLHSKRFGLKGQLKPLLELESGSNDPMAVFLTVGMVELVKTQSFSFAELLQHFCVQMSLGLTLGYLFGFLFARLINKLKLEYEGLYTVCTLALVLISYGGTACLGGNGFLAVYVTGLVLANSNFIRKKSIMRFQDGIAWLMQIAMFMTLGLLIVPKEIIKVAPKGFLIAIVLVVIARPVAVFLSLLLTKMGIRERLMISWVGLRGAVPIVLATFPLLDNLPKAREIFNLVFFIVITSVLIQGTTIPWFARLLKVDTPFKRKPHYPIELEQIDGGDMDLIDFQVPDDSPISGQNLVSIKMPKDSLIVLVKRNQNYILPSGSTVLEGGDTLLVLVSKYRISAIEDVLAAK
jgi:cell volume regulation protein A